MKSKLLLCIASFLFLVPISASQYQPTQPTAGSTVSVLPEITPVASSLDVYSTSSIKAYIQSQFPDAPVMANIASCESHFRQFKSDGTVLRGIENTSDTGVFMVNLYYHQKEATQRGLDLEKLEDNVAFARILYDRSGTRDWNWSKYPIGKFKGWAQGDCE